MLTGFLKIHFRMIHIVQIHVKLPPGKIDMFSVRLLLGFLQSLQQLYNFYTEYTIQDSETQE